jgi:hypothetical protein
MVVLPTRPVRSSGRKRYQPAVGAAFDLDEVPTIEAKTRGFLARLIALSAAAAIAVAAANGLMTGHYSALQVVWAVVGPLAGALMTHYFGAYRRHEP